MPDDLRLSLRTVRFALPRCGSVARAQLSISDTTVNFHFQ
jgi:hypothetical protein